ncbi:MAG TPA: DUF2079 domain-containing protein [Phycisphaerae bacterium]|nr:DUF2079 domain-containing protein [Phycisphaerae bacterium]
MAPRLESSTPATVVSFSAIDRVHFALGLLGLAAFLLAIAAIDASQFNVVTYDTEQWNAGRYVPSLIFVEAVLSWIVILALLAGKASRAAARWATVGACLCPLLLAAPVSIYIFTGSAPPFALGFLVILAGGWAAFRAGARLPAPAPRPWGHPVALTSVCLLIGVLVFIHTRLQINFFEHFMLGHADIGHRTEELKNALAGRGLCSDSFDNVPMAWHFTPLMYVLVPGYALWPSPTFLMFCGAMLVHLPAIPAYWLARRLSRSTAVGWAFAAAWLLLPSQSRLIYASTYGFQWVYFTMPLLGGMVATGVLGRWRTSLVLAGLVLLCRETAAAATFGWAIYLVLFTPRRKTGIAIGLVSLVYAAICITVLIPQIADGRYERLDLFGELGRSPIELLAAPLAKPALFFGRLARPQTIYFLLMLLVPMALLPLAGWRLAIAALPTLLLVCQMQNPDWLTIKFWHQVTVLTVLFFAGVASMANRPRTGLLARWVAARAHLPPDAWCRGAAAAVLTCAALAHYLFAFSPLSNSYRPYAFTSQLHEPDPRLAIVRALREQIPKKRTILATERIAAHFTDYRHIYTGRRIQPADVVVIDRSDRWDRSGLPQQVSRFAEDTNYRLHGEYGSIVVFTRQAAAPVEVNRDRQRPAR